MAAWRAWRAAGRAEVGWRGVRVVSWVGVTQHHAPRLLLVLRGWARALLTAAAHALICVATCVLLLEWSRAWLLARCCRTAAKVWKLVCSSSNCSCGFLVALWGAPVQTCQLAALYTCSSQHARRAHACFHTCWWLGCTAAQICLAVLRYNYPCACMNLAQMWLSRIDKLSWVANFIRS